MYTIHAIVPNINYADMLISFSQYPQKPQKLNALKCPTIQCLSIMHAILASTYDHDLHNWFPFVHVFILL